ncbi:MAG: hypothetical protein L0323_04305 [Planctomycetes bacterium]|nr:hypothetical protein [Planctomycetota bacterium]
MRGWLMLLGTVIGILGGAYPRDREMIAGIPGGTPLVAGGVALLVVALALRLQHRPVSEAARGSAAAAGEAIGRVAPDVEALLPEARQLPIADLARRLDGLIEKNLFPVYAAQQALVASQGFAGYAAHTGPWAAGERMLYRAWSAATDGHRPEAVASMEEAVRHFGEARSEWERVTARRSGGP